MKLTVFGANGGVGREIVRQALSAGHQVTAVVRDPAGFPVTGQGLDVVRVADLSATEALRPLVAGREGVLSGLGAKARKDAGITTRLTRSVVDAMEAEGVRRLVVVSAAPVGPAPADQPALDRVMGATIKMLLKDVYADLAAMESLLAASATDWTSVRPPRLTDKPLTGTYRTVVGGTPRKGRTIARADVAHAMLQSLTDPTTANQPLGLAN